MSRDRMFHMRVANQLRENTDMPDTMHSSTPSYADDFMHGGGYSPRHYNNEKKDDMGNAQYNDKDSDNNSENIGDQLFAHSHVMAMAFGDTNAGGIDPLPLVDWRDATHESPMRGARVEYDYGCRYASLETPVPPPAPTSRWWPYNDRSDGACYTTASVRQDLSMKWEQFDIDMDPSGGTRQVFQDIGNQDLPEYEVLVDNTTSVSSIESMHILFTTSSAPCAIKPTPPPAVKPTRKRKRPTSKSMVPNHSPETNHALRAWMAAHVEPYPTLEDKVAIANKLGLTVKQVNNFCNNYRKRYHKCGDKTESYLFRSSHTTKP